MKLLFDWLDLLAVQETLKSLLQHHSSKASLLQCSAFFMAQLSHPNMTTGKIIALALWTFIDKVMSLLFNMLSRLVIVFLPRNKPLLISWLHSPSTVILEAMREKKNMPEDRGKLGEAYLGFGAKAMPDGVIISSPYQFVLILRLFVPVLLLFCFSFLVSNN